VKVDLDEVILADQQQTFRMRRTPPIDKTIEGNLYDLNPVFPRNNINIVGTGPKTMLLAHGFGCDQNMWRFIVPAFQRDYRVVLFDQVGAGKSDLSQYRRERYSSLQGYAQDILEIIDAVGGAPVVFVGHSVSAMIGLLAAIRRPESFERLVLVGPSPCYVNDDNYVGGFSKRDIDGLLEMLDSNHLGWSNAMAPVIMGNPGQPELADELAESFCRTDPEIAKQFAEVTFLSDNRSDLPLVKTPALVLQCSEDVIAPDTVGEFVHRGLSDSKFVRLRATGHCPHLSAPNETIAAIKEYLGGPGI
jgi:sigma-B regulation protein RsbQ